MTATTEELYKEWHTAYLGRGNAITKAGKAKTWREEDEILKTHERPHFLAQVAIEDAVFASDAQTVQELAFKVLLAFTDTSEPMEGHRESLIADAVRITGLPAMPADGDEADTTSKPAYDPLPGWCEQYKLVYKEHLIVCERCTTGRIDSPEILEVESRLNPLENLICNTAPVTMEGAAAQLEFIMNGMAGDFEWTAHVPMLARVITALRGMEQ